MNKALLVALTACTLIPAVDIDSASAHPRGWRRYYRPGPVYRPFYGPVYRPRFGPVLIMPPPPPIVYVEPPPPPPRVVVVRERYDEERYEPPPPPPTYAPPAPAPNVYQQPEKEEPPTRDFIAIGLHFTGATVEGEKVGISTAENPSMGGIGVHFRARFSEAFGIELAADFLEGSADEFDLTQSTIPLMAGLTWHILPTSRFQPYLIGGIGVHFTRLEYFGGDYAIDMADLAGQLGGGVEVFLTENLALHADLRFQSVFKALESEEKIASDCIEQVGTQSGFCDNIHFTDEADKVDLGVSLSVGASWYF